MNLTPQGIDGAERAYREGRYDDAAELYRAQLSDPDSPHAGAVLFNLGNCALKTDQPAAALWHYRRAALRLPDEPAIAANARRAEERLGLAGRASGTDATLNFSSGTSAAVESSPAAIAAIPDAWLLGAAVLLQGAGLIVLFRGGRKLRFAVGTALLLAGVLAALPLWSRADRTEHPEAIVLVPEAILLGEPRDGAPPVLRVGRGESLQVIEKSDTWAHVAHGEDRGWIRLRSLGVID